VTELLLDQRRRAQRINRPTGVRGPPKQHPRQPPWRHQRIPHRRHIVIPFIILDKHRLPKQIPDSHPQRPR
jgi:hypothetical protein